MKDLNKGSEGVVMGYNEHLSPIVKFLVEDEGKPRELTHVHDAGKLILADEAEASSSKAKAKGKATANTPPVDTQYPPGHAYLMHGIEAKDRTKVTLVPWTHLQQEDSDAQLLYDTKARIAVLTDLARQQLVAYNEEDFTVVLRQPKPGGDKKDPSVEVWTKKAFDPHTLMLAPSTTEIKDCYWTKGRSVMVNLPKTVSKSLRGKTLALDGRRRNMFREAKEANLGDQAKEETHGDIFFAIERTTERTKANLFLSYVEMPLHSSLTLPNGKKVKISLDSSYLPDVPLLTNPHKIPARTRLIALDDIALRNIMLKMEEEKAEKLRKEAALAAKKAAAAKRKAS